MAEQDPNVARNAVTQNLTDAERAAAAAAIRPTSGQSSSTVGFYGIWVVDKNGHLINFPQDNYVARSPPDPSDSKAIDIYFGIKPAIGPQVPKDQLDLQLEISKLLRAITSLYINEAGVQNAKFRLYFVRLFRIAQLGLEGPFVHTTTAKLALAELTNDLISMEAGNVKNRHLKKLGIYAFIFSLPFLLLYYVVMATTTLSYYLDAFFIEYDVFANFMLLWVGCFIGVWISYGIRTSTFTLNDLTITDSDRLAPAARLLFAGFLSMIVGIFFILKIIDIKIGTYPVTDIANQPILAFLIGAFCGISELTLSDAVGKRVTTFIGAVK